MAVKNVVLVHGAWADGSSWSKVIPLLQHKGLHAVAVQNPLRRAGTFGERHQCTHHSVDLRMPGVGCDKHAHQTARARAAEQLLLRRDRKPTWTSVKSRPLGSCWSIAG